MNETNPYKKKDWIDHIIDSRFPSGHPDHVVQEGTRAYAEFFNNMEKGIYEAYNWLIEDSRRLQRVEVKQALQDRSSSNNVFYDPFDGQAPSKATLDTTSAVIKTPLVEGETTLQVDKTEGFREFTEVSIYDNVNYEDLLITEIDAESKTIKVQALTKSYKKGAIIARSNVLINTNDREMNIGQWGNYSVTAVEVT